MGTEYNKRRNKKNEYRGLFRNLEGKRPLERPRRRWEDNIGIDLDGMGWDIMNWIDLAEHRD
jgi:hypothetical protein